MAGQRRERSVELVRGLSFRSVADQYERYRLDYPDELVDAVLQYAGRPVRSALEVGAGTGKATRLFASRGIQVTALEPDAEMAHVLRRTTRGMPVHPVVTTFEQFDTARRFDLLYAAAAWHWTKPAARWARAVELLVPGGVLALFGSPAEPQDPTLSAAIEEIEKQVLPNDDRPPSTRGRSRRSPPPPASPTPRSANCPASRRRRPPTMRDDWPPSRPTSC